MSNARASIPSAEKNPPPAHGPLATMTVLCMCITLIIIVLGLIVHSIKSDNVIKGLLAVAVLILSTLRLFLMKKPSEKKPRRKGRVS